MCVTESLFIHVTVVPTETSSSSGANALFPKDSAPTGIVTEDVGPTVEGDGVDEGEGAVDGDE